MQPITDFLSALPSIPIEHMVGLIALAGLGLAIFAIYVVFAVIRLGSGKANEEAPALD